jgi:hypothetical protein
VDGSAVFIYTRCTFEIRNKMRNFFPLVFILLIYPAVCFAGSWEYYVEPKVKIPIDKKDSLYLNVKEETRFKDGVNYYDKTFLGVSKKLGRDFEFAFYSAEVEKKKKNKWDSSYLVWPELAYKHKFGRFELDSNTKLEYEITEDIWKFREQAGFALPINNKISFWIGDEPRVFSLFERAYFGENEALAGFIFNLATSSSVDIFYDLRSIKQSGGWENTNCLRVALNFKF